MPPRRGKKSQKGKKARSQADPSFDVTIDHVHEQSKTVVHNTDSTAYPGHVPKLASLPPELFDEIIAYFPTLPLNWYYDTTVGIPDVKYAVRAAVLRSLAGTCKAMRAVALPRLWSRLDVCLVPLYAHGTWYKYVAQALKRKADGVATLDASTREYVRTVTFTITKHDIDRTMPCVLKLLSALQNLHTIQVLQCRIAGEFKAAVAGLSLPSVRTLVLPTAANALVPACPNVTHVRCAGGPGSALVAAMMGSKCEVLDGMIDWCADPKLVNRLVKYAPHLTTLEIRRPMSRGLGIRGQNTVPAGWASIIPALSGLKQLRTLTLTFPKREEEPADAASIKAAREVMRCSALKGEKKLVIRRVQAPHYTLALSQELDLVLTYDVEIFG